MPDPSGASTPSPDEVEPLPEGPEDAVEAEHGAVLQGEDTEPTGLAATTAEGEATGEDATEPGGSPEEQAERVEQA